MYLTWVSFNNIRMLVMACMPIVIFYLIWLVNTSESIRSEEGTLLDLVCWPDGNAIPVMVALVSIIAVIIELYGLYQLFKAGLPKCESDVTNGLYYYIWALIFMIIIILTIMFYSGLQSAIIRAKLKGGIIKAMLRYSSHLPSKVAIDRLQTRFQCCGRVSYQEWFYIPWDVSPEKQADSHPTHSIISDSVPYSCCSKEVMFPCIHHGVSKKSVIYKYDPSKGLTIWESGCEEKLINEMMAVSFRLNMVMGLISLFMILKVIAVRYLHTAYKAGLHIDNRITCRAYLLRSLSDVDTLARRARRRLRSGHIRRWLSNVSTPWATSTSEQELRPQTTQTNPQPDNEAPDS